jgi:hypothetical protein
MRGWLVSVDGRLSPEKRSALSDASIAVRGVHPDPDGGARNPTSAPAFTVELEAEDPDQASVKVAEALGADGFSGFSVREVNPSDG